jgi:hypothetical protein
VEIRGVTKWNNTRQELKRIPLFRSDFRRPMIGCREIM